MKPFAQWMGDQLESIVDESHIGPHTHQPTAVENPEGPVWPFEVTRYDEDMREKEETYKHWKYSQGGWL